MGSGEIPMDDGDWEEWEDVVLIDNKQESQYSESLSPIVARSPQTVHSETSIGTSSRRRGSVLCAVYNVSMFMSTRVCTSAVYLSLVIESFARHSDASTRVHSIYFRVQTTRPLSYRALCFARRIISFKISSTFVIFF